MDNSRKVTDYYRLVDENNFTVLADLFSDDIFYNRAGMVISTKDNFLDFYQNHRSIVGHHKIKEILEKNNLFVVLGVFLHNSGKEENFVDIFWFDNNGKIRDRETYLLRGSEKIQ